LVECHAWLVSWFLGLIVLVSGLEVAGGGPASRMSGALLVLGGLAVILYSWKRYHLLLEIAERLGEQATCPGCNAYGKFRIQSSGPAPMPDGGDPALENHGGGVWMLARCRKCGDEWMIQ
jgi:hypothetical protein